MDDYVDEVNGENILNHGICVSRWMTRLPCTVLWYSHVQFQPKTAKNEVPKEHVLCENLVVTSTRCAAEWHQRIIVPHWAQALPSQICLSSQDTRTKNEPWLLKHHEYPPPKQQEFVLLPFANFAIPTVKTELLSSANVCRQLHHHRLLLLEFLLLMKIFATHLRRLECQDIRDMLYGNTNYTTNGVQAIKVSM